MSEHKVPTLESLPDLSTDKELSNFLGKSPITLWRERKNGKLPFRRISGSVRYAREDIATYLDRCKRNAEYV